MLSNIEILFQISRSVCFIDCSGKLQVRSFDSIMLSVVGLEHLSRRASVVY